jgi:hypothetical protein
VPGNSLLEIQFAPQGIITDSYPEDTAAAGKDLFQDPTRRQGSIQQLGFSKLRARFLSWNGGDQPKKSKGLEIEMGSMPIFGRHVVPHFVDERPLFRSTVTPQMSDAVTG